MRAGTTVGILVTTLTLAPARPALGQDAHSPEATARRVALSGGWGTGTNDFGGLASLSVGDARADLILRWAETTEWVIFRDPAESTSDVALLYGRRVVRSRGWLRGSVGLGYVWAVRRGNDEACWLFFCSHDRISSSSLGLALQAEAVWAPWKPIGIGVTAVGNLNPEASFGALTVAVYLGVLR